MKTRGIVILAGAMLMAVPVFAQDVVVLDGRQASGVPSRAQFDIDMVSVSPTRKAETYSWSTVEYSETATALAYYSAPKGQKVVQLGGAVRLVGPVGVSLRARRRVFQEEALEVATLPHPLYVGLPATASALSRELLVSETSVDMGVTVYLPTSREWVVRVSGGPTFFKGRRDMVAGVTPLRSLDSSGRYSAVLTADTTKAISVSGWGVNAGGDVAYFVSKNVGAGLTAGIDRGSLPLVDPLSGRESLTRAGGVWFGGGLRVRF